jgi:DNA uptake protein ComE-like DNA-binding protein
MIHDHARPRAQAHAHAYLSNPTLRPRHAFILMAVLIVMVCAILVATSLLFVGQTEAAGAAGAADAAQARALLWSGTQVILAELSDQKQRILAGELPTVEQQYVIYETTSRAGIVRLLPIGRGGGLLDYEAGKLDINVIDAAALTRTGFVDAAVAEAIVSWRSRLGRPIQSSADLLEAPGVSVTTLYGSIDALLAPDRAVARVGSRAPAMDEVLAAPARGLADVITIFSFEPAVQRTGKLRINLNVQWSDELASRVEERFGRDAVATLKQIFDSGVKFENEAALFAALRRFQTPPDQWPQIIDTFTCEQGDLHFGRIDLNSASREALTALPGVTAEQAEQIISVRSELSPDQRATIAWPALREILKPEQYEALAGRITTRCWTYRVRLAVGEIDRDDPTGRINNPQIHEIVVDLSGPTARLAYLRDVTLLHDAALMAHEATGASAAIEPIDLAGTAAFTDGQDGSAATLPADSRPSRDERVRPLPTRETGSVAGEDVSGETDQHPSRMRLGRWTAGPR